MKLLIMAAAVCLLGINQSQAQDDKLPSAESILKKFCDVTGGADNYKAIKSMRAEGTLSVPQAGITGSLKVQAILNENKIRADISIPGVGDQKRGSDGKTFWDSSVMMGDRIIEGEEASSMKEEATMERIYDPKSFYKSMKTVGVEEVEGEKCYKLDLVKRNDKKVEAYYGVESGLEVKTVQTQESPMGAMKIESFSKDYRQVGKVKTSFEVVQKLPNGMSQIIAMDKVEYNVDIPASTFELPESIKKMVEKKAAKAKEKAAAGSGK